MRISDWSSDVCSSDLEAAIDTMYREAMRILAPGGIMFHSVNCGDHYAYVDRSIHQLHYLKYSDRQWRFWEDRKSVVSGKSASVRVDLGGPRLIKNNKQLNLQTTDILITTNPLL